MLLLSPATPPGGTAAAAMRGAAHITQESFYRWFLLLVLLTVYTGGLTESAATCKRWSSTCKNGDCYEEIPCIHGHCDETGQCVCLPCYNDNSCNTYVDSYGPNFIVPDATVIIEQNHTGVIFEATATDDDFAITCAKNNENDCPCSVVHYFLHDESPDFEGSPFQIDSRTGEVTLQHGEILEPEQQYHLEIIATNSNDSSDVDHLYIDAMSLTVIIKPQTIYNSLAYNNLYQENMEDPNLQEFFPESIPYPNIEPQVLSRSKRDAPGSTSGDTQLTLTQDAGSNGTLRPGDKLSYTLTVALPKIATANKMDLKVEVFVMDAVSGISPFALCNIHVASKGAQVQYDQPKITPELNLEFYTFYDRAVIDFGSVSNEASIGSTDYTDSTIEIKFDAVLIRNVGYQNDSVFVTAGAEFDQQNYVWVSQSSYSFEMEPDADYRTKIEMEAQDTINENSGEGFIVKSYITNPFDKLFLEVYTADDVVDKFTITSLFVKSKGSNWACVQESLNNITLYPSVTGRTNQRAMLEVQLINCGSIADAEHATAVDEEDNLIEFGFVIYAVDAEDSEKISVGAGISIGVTTIWTAIANLTTGPKSPDPGSVTYTPGERISSATVPEYGAATFVIIAELPSKQDATISCSAPGTSDASVCGVMYGAIGQNVAYLPKLTDYLTIIDGGTAGWNFDTGTIKTLNFGDNSTLNTIEFEVSVKYSASPGTLEVTCGGSPITLDGISTTPATSEVVTGELLSMAEETTWYAGSQAGIQLRLSIPGGLAYSSLILESSGDLEAKSYGSRICSARLISAGNGVPCSNGNINKINGDLIKQESLGESKYEDSAQMNLGSTCGVSRDDGVSANTDNDLIFEFIYELPKDETVTGDDAFTLSTGLLLGDDQIWTGWENFTISSSGPPYDSSKTPVFEYLELSSNNLLIGSPEMISVVLKTHPGSVGTYTIKFTSKAPATLGICRISILAVGSNYGCVDLDPYGKSNEPNQHQTITHDADDWGKEATLSLGTLRNLARGEISASKSADADTILLGVYVKGIAGGTADLEMELDNSGNTNSKLTIDFTVDSANFTPNKALSLTTAVVLSGTTLHGEKEFEAYKGVMKIAELTMTVDPKYSNMVKLEFINEKPEELNLCLAQVTTVGKNVPCLLPFQIVPVITSDISSFTIELDLKEVCHYPLSDETTENEVVVRVGVTFMEDASSASVDIKIKLTEGQDPAKDLTSFTFTKLDDALEKEVNVSDGMKLELISNETETVKPGDRLYVGVKFTLPMDVTAPMEVGIMTPSDAGRAYATVHGFRFDKEKGGKNLGCLYADCQLYNPIIAQNASLDDAMIHPTQTDTLVANINYITNAAISYLQKDPKPEDDQMYIEADILIADHENASDTDIISISFAVKAGNFIYVIEKPLTLSKPADLEMSILGEFLLSSDDSSQVFKKDDKVTLTGRFWHEANVSRQEANNAIVRFFLPKYMHFVESDDTYDSNMTVNFINKHYLDFGIDYLFFTDLFEVNFTLTVDPNDELPKGLGIINATSLMRLVCKTNTQLKDKLRYCAKTLYAQYPVESNDCKGDLNVALLEDERFSASTAIDETVGPKEAAKGNGWSPAMRPGTMDNYITIDFKKKTRVTKITFENTGNGVPIDTFKIQYSYSGMMFTDACNDNITVDSMTAELPSQCRFEARFARIVVVTTQDSSTQLSVKFKWFGCTINNNDDDEAPLSNFYTSYTNIVKQPKPWRHAAYDDVNKVFYFCDYSLKKKRIACLSSSDDGASWTALPSYIGYLLGVYEDNNQKSFMYAKDRKDKSTVRSNNGVDWGIVDEYTANVINSKDINSVAIKGTKDIQQDISSDWKGDFTGIKFDGDYKVKWDACCA